jgi:carbamoyl-phosphate synthase large subunit
MIEIGLEVPRSASATRWTRRGALAEIGLPASSARLHLGGTGGGIAYNEEEFDEIVANGLDASPITRS